MKASPKNITVLEANLHETLCLVKPLPTLLIVFNVALNNLVIEWLPYDVTISSLS